MIKVLLLLALFVIVYPLVRVWWILHKLRKQVNETMRAASDAAAQAEKPQKRYADDVGEYADFEDVPDDDTPLDEAQTARPDESQPQQPLIVDADYEDVPDDSVTQG